MALIFRKFIEGIRVLPKNALTVSGLEKGDLQVLDDADGKLQYHNGTSQSPVVTEAHAATLTNKTIDSPLIITPTVDSSITGEVGSSLTIQSAVNEDLVLQSQGTGDVTIQSSGSVGVTVENLKISQNTLEGGSSSSLTVQSSSNNDLLLQSQGTGNVSIQSSGSTGVLIEETYLNSSTISNPNTLEIKTENVISGALGDIKLTPFTNRSIQLNGASAVKSQSVTVGGSGEVTLTSPFGIISTPIVEITSLVPPWGLVVGSSAKSNFFILSNKSGSTTTVRNNQTVSAPAYKIFTGTGGDVSLENNQSVLLIFDTGTSSWNLIGLPPTLVPTTATTITTSPSTLSYPLDVAFIDVSGLASITLPAPTAGKTIFIKKINSTTSAATLLPPTGTIDGASSWILASQYDSVTLSSDGVNFYVIDSYNSSVISVSGNTTLSNGNDTAIVSTASGPLTITLPAPKSGKKFTIKKITTPNTITINTISGTIDGAATKSIINQYDCLTFVSDGTNYFIT